MTEKAQDQGKTKNDQPQEPKPKRASRARKQTPAAPPPGVGINDPALYAEMSVPFATKAEANAALSAFLMAVRMCRIRYRIADVVTVACVTTPEGALITHGQNGDSAKTALMLAWSLGATEAEEQARVDTMRRRGRDGTYRASVAVDRSRSTPDALTPTVEDSR